ncbi:MAG TPA: RiPP maturation radical SAM C-methyltransferase [Kofleriaceae bacterium]|nr:RiPP maturation radical SAM C-methyltransferase [Kofleriaceae bacterium]
MSTSLPGSPRILLAQMPWASTTRPSIALGILGQLCSEAEIEHRCIYLNMDTAAAVGARETEAFADDRGLFGLSEHLFACDLFGPRRLASDGFLESFCAAATHGPPLGDLDWLRRTRDRIIPQLLSRMAERVLAHEPTVVGFSAMFNQVMPILALAARLRRARPSLRIICGGASFDDEMGMEYHRALHDVIDHVFLAEAEDSFREFLARLVSGRSTAAIPGVTWWEDGEVRLIKGGPLADMNRSPTPDYAPYFAERARAERELGLQFALDRLPFESSRGCWWGEKNHCVFCGLNPEVLPFRAKSIERSMDEITALISRHQVTRLIATDWIVSREQRGELFRRLGERGYDVEIFYETRADMPKQEILLMAEAGVHRIQPGIESFSTPLLRHMRKHSQGIRQVQFLRWCREAGVHPLYHLLAGFPGEDPAWFAEMEQLVPRLRHLVPPRHNVFTIELHRFSPLFNRRAEFGIKSYDIRVDYRFNFPEGVVDLRKTGYFFDFESDMLGDVDSYLAPLRGAVGAWMAAHDRAEPPRCTYHVGPGFVGVVDTRDGNWREHSYVGVAADVLLLCDKISSRAALAEDLARRHRLADGQLDRVLDGLRRRDLLLVEGELLLTLPVSNRPRSTEWLRAHVLGAEADRPRKRLAVAAATS